ncbi:MAG: succinate dehydrogenase, cytochrome b556 subunit [Armatimonadota bacterium]|nr:succinate dehydrogenase, cytochrome b556 subunit [Armatimonadota bacterium]MDR7463678.1 succinate dehydrogenase, cytochrome b556 subunit [Armatimonadota bacterium]MDR7468599.1 succinate dehydrogenase, cytochrome b556 subunit [Armatimonadota bacterium]MDR7538105.1 succinate dehydrogenase, cytochrome b556 subunit [Armatimonadota bacterium]
MRSGGAARLQVRRRLGVRGWIYAGRYGIDRYLYVLQRVSGLGLVLYLLLHIYETGARLRGEAAWTATMALFRHPVFVFLEFVVFAGFIYHALNGVRLMVAELGWLLGAPARPVYPYGSSLSRHRPWVYALMLLGGVLLALAATDIFALPG